MPNCPECGGPMFFAPDFSLWECEECGYDEIDYEDAGRNDYYNGDEDPDDLARMYPLEVGDE